METMVLADFEIVHAIRAGELAISPFSPEMVRPAALSLRLGTTASVLVSQQEVDAARQDSYPVLIERSLDEAGRLRIGPGEIVLASTFERIRMPPSLTGLLDGISDVARLGLSVTLSNQVSPGFGEPNGGVLTLEISSRLEHPVLLHPGVRICNLMLFRCHPPTRAYADLPFNHSADSQESPSTWFSFHPPTV